MVYKQATNILRTGVHKTSQVIKLFIPVVDKKVLPVFCLHKLRYGQIAAKHKKNYNFS